MATTLKSKIKTVLRYLDDNGMEHDTEAEAIESNCVIELADDIQAINYFGISPREIALWLREYYTLTKK